MKNNNKVESNLGDLLLHLKRNIRKSFKNKDIKQDLTFSQVEILHFIGISGQKTMKSIAEHLEITPPSVTEIIAELENKKIVKRISGSEDRRVVSVVLTDKAKRIFTSVLSDKQTILNQMTAKLCDDDQIALERIIKILTT